MQRTGSISVPAAFAAATLALISSNSAMAQQPRFRIIDLTDIGFVPNLNPQLNGHGTMSINNLGQVVYTRMVGTEMHGWVYLPEPAFGISFSPANSGIIDLSDAVGVGESAAWDINMAGQIVGQVAGSHLGEGRAFLWQLGNPVQGYELGVVQTQSPWSVAFAINDAWPALVVGDALEMASFGNCDYENVGFRLEFSGVQAPEFIPAADLLHPPIGSADNGAYARAVNTPANPEEPARIVGLTWNPIPLFCNDSGCNPAEDPMTWSDESTVEVDSLLRLTGGGGHRARGVNNQGYIVGEGWDSTQAATCKLRAMFWQDSAATPFNLGTVNPIPVLQQTRALAINDRNPVQVVGKNLTSGHPTLWEQDGAGGWRDVVDLQNEIAPTSGWELVDAHDINDRGCIVGFGFRNNEEHAFLLYEGCSADCAPGNNAIVDVSDLLKLLADWDTTNPPCDGGGVCDTDGDGCVGVTDLLTLLGQWGPCCKLGGGSTMPTTVQECFQKFGLDDPVVLESCICAVDPQECE